jgi:hypothetical protein
MVLSGWTGAPVLHRRPGSRQTFNDSGNTEEPEVMSICTIVQDMFSPLSSCSARLQWLWKQKAADLDSLIYRPNTV